VGINPAVLGSYHGDQIMHRAGRRNRGALVYASLDSTSPNTARGRNYRVHFTVRQHTTHASQVTPPAWWVTETVAVYRLSLTPLSQSTHGTRAGGVSLLQRRTPIPLISEPPPIAVSRYHPHPVRQWVHTSAIRPPIGSGDVVHSLVTCGGGGASSDSSGRILPQRKRGTTRRLRKSAGGGGGSESCALLGSHERNVR